VQVRLCVYLHDCLWGEVAPRGSGCGNACAQTPCTHTHTHSPSNPPSYEGNALEDPWVQPDESMFTRSVSPEQARLSFRPRSPYRPRL
jgi:hypothetical protein